MVTRMAQQDPQLQAAFAHQARQQQQQQPAIPTMYPQQVIFHSLFTAFRNFSLLLQIFNEVSLFFHFFFEK